MRKPVLLAGLLAVGTPALADDGPVVQVARGQSIEVPRNARCMDSDYTIWSPVERNGHWYCELA